ncbi:MAG: hypothetical protein FK733_08900 [Asgard group archaeon]|nr:hypothetical protein [Asgard group archaeon]
MSQEKADSGTIVLNSDGSELGVIKKVYTNNLARLELTDSTSVAIDLDLITDLTSSGRIIKKKSATIKPEINVFFQGATDTLNQLLYNSVELLANHLATKESKKALQHFEFDLLTKYDFVDKLPFYQILGLIRGIELTSKTTQDSIVKAIFQSIESKPELSNVIAPEILVDKLNQEKAFNRILWNLLRVCVSQVIKHNSNQLIFAVTDALFEIGLKFIDTEFKLAVSTIDLLHWNERLDDCILKYIVLMIMELESDEKQNLWDELKNNYNEVIRKTKVNNNLKEHMNKLLDTVSFEETEQYKVIELLHSGIKGFNLKVMSEKKAMSDLCNLINSLLEQEKSVKVSTLQKEITSFIQNTRDVSKDFTDTLFEIVQYLKKIEYGDSKVRDFYSEIVNKIQNFRYYELLDILDHLNRKFVK